MYHFASVATRVRRGIDRVINRTFTLALLVWLTCKPAFADLPTVEAPTSNGGSGLMGQIKGYLQDGVVIGGLVVAAIAFINVAIAAVHTFTEVRNEKSTRRSLAPSSWWVWCYWLPLSGCWASPPTLFSEAAPCRPFAFYLTV